MESLAIFLLLFSALVLIGSCWCIVFPRSAQRTLAWWIAMPRGICYTAGIAQIALGVAVLVEAVRKVQNVVIIAAVIVGLLLMFKGSIYFWENGITSIGQRFTAPHSTVWLRAVGIFGVAVVILLTYLALQKG